MSDAPDFLYADHGLIAWRFKGFNEPGLTPYVRRDLAVLAGLPEAKALITAAVEGAAQRAGSLGKNAEKEAEAPSTTANQKTALLLVRDTAFTLEAAIRASIPADAKDALDAYVAGKMREVRSAALREALEANRLARFGVIYSGEKARIDGISEGHDRAETAIRALIEEDKP